MKCNKWLSCFCVIFSMLVGSFTSAYCENQQEFIVGTTSGYAPFVSLNQQGEYEGFDIDFAQALAKQMGKKLVIKDLGCMNSLMLALSQKKVDALIWAISITEDRKKNMAFVHYQGGNITQFPLVFWKKIPKDFKTMEDLVKNPKYHVCVEAGSSQEGVLRCYPNLKIRYIDKLSDALMEIKYGKSIATSIDNALVPEVESKYSDAKIAWLDLPKSQQSFGFGVCLHKENTALIQEVDAAVSKMKKAGIITELEKKWNLSKY